MEKNLNVRHIICQGLIFAFLLNSFGPLPVARAQDYVLPAPGILVHLSPAFNPPILKGIKVYPDNPFHFDFVLDPGDKSSNDTLKDESSKLIKYFLASLTVPDKDLWVNLSPYEKDRIVPGSFGQTEMGRDLLGEDYILKQITASLIYPEGETGKKFWKSVYIQAVQRFHTTNIPVNTFNKVWIVPEKAVVYENSEAGTAYVVESKLKVMLEEDYLSLGRHNASNISNDRAHTLASDIIRQIIIPELDREVNEGANFAELRQVYNSLILARWYKKKIKDSILAAVYNNKNKVGGLSNALAENPEQIYLRYLKAFKKGVYNYIKEEKDPITQQPIARKYFSGGMVLSWKNWAMLTVYELPVSAVRMAHALRLRVNLVKFKIKGALIASGLYPSLRDKEMPFQWIILGPYIDHPARLAEKVKKFAGEHGFDWKTNEYLMNAHSDREEALGALLENLAQHEYFLRAELGLGPIYFRLYASSQPKPGIRLEFWGEGKHPFPKQFLDVKSNGRRYKWFDVANPAWTTFFAPDDAVTGGVWHMGVTKMFRAFGKDVEIAYRQGRNGHFIGVQFLMKHKRKDRAMISLNPLQARNGIMPVQYSYENAVKYLGKIMAGRKMAGMQVEARVRMNPLQNRLMFFFSSPYKDRTRRLRLSGYSGDEWILVNFSWDSQGVLRTVRFSPPAVESTANGHSRKMSSFLGVPEAQMDARVRDEMINLARLVKTAAIVSKNQDPVNINVEMPVQYFPELQSVSNPLALAAGLPTSQELKAIRPDRVPQELGIIEPVEPSSFVLTYGHLIDFQRARTYNDWVQNLGMRERGQFNREFFSNLIEMIKSYEENGNWRDNPTAQGGKARKMFIMPGETIFGNNGKRPTVSALEMNGFYQSEYFINGVLRPYTLATSYDTGQKRAASFYNDEPRTRERVMGLMKDIIQVTSEDFLDGKIKLNQISPTWKNWPLKISRMSPPIILRYIATGGMRVWIPVLTLMLASMMNSTISASIAIGFASFSFFNLLMFILRWVRQWAGVLEHRYYERALQDYILGANKQSRKNVRKKFNNNFRLMKTGLKIVAEASGHEDAQADKMLDKLRWYILHGLKNYRQYIWTSELGMELIKSGIKIDVRDICVSMLKELSDQNPRFFRNLVSWWRFQVKLNGILTLGGRLGSRDVSIPQRFLDMLPLIEVQRRESRLFDRAKRNVEEGVVSADDNLSDEDRVDSEFLRLTRGSYEDRLEGTAYFADELFKEVSEFEDPADRRTVMLTHFLGLAARLRSLSQDAEEQRKNKQRKINTFYSKPLIDAFEKLWRDKVFSLRTNGDYGLNLVEVDSILDILYEYENDLIFYGISASPPANAAMKALENKVGGIDLTSDKALLVQNNGQGIKFHMDTSQLSELQDASGFVPVIINIQPMPDIRSFLSEPAH